MSEIERIIEDYVSAWNSSSLEERKTLLSNILAEDCLYVDSHLPNPIIGKEAHGLFIERFKAKFPDLSLNMTASPDLHHGYFRFNWQIVKVDGNIFTVGSFFGAINKENKISKLVGFVNEK